MVSPVIFKLSVFTVHKQRRRQEKIVNNTEQLEKEIGMYQLSFCSIS